MASYLPGPLAIHASGSAGGTVFKTAPGQDIFYSLISPVRHSSPNALAVRDLTRSGSFAWSELSAADRALWDYFAYALLPRHSRYGLHRLTGRQAYIASWIAQAGDPAAAAPVLPIPGNVPLSVTGVYTTYLTDLYLTALSRSLTSLEYCLFRVHAVQSPLRNTPSRKLYSTIVLPYNQLDTTAFTSLLRDHTTDTWLASGLAALGTNFSVNLWFYPITPPLESGSAIYQFTTSLILSQLNYAGYLTLEKQGGSRLNIAPTPSSDAWHMLTLNYISAAHVTQCYLDGAGPLLSTDVFTWDIAGILYFTSRYATGIRAHMALANFEIRDELLSAANITAKWNSGHSALPSLDSHSIHYWPFRSAPDASSPDIGTVPKNAATTGLSSRPGPPARLAYPASATPWSTSRTVRITSRVHVPTYHLGPSIEDRIIW